MSDLDTVEKQPSVPSDAGVVRPTRAHLADAFQVEGEHALLQGDLIKGLECFESALKLDPENPRIYLAQGLSLFEFATKEKQEKVLSLANKRFKVATTLSPQDFAAWQAWGSALCMLGLLSEKHHYFKEAKNKLNTAISLSQHQGKESLSELYWDLGIVFSQLADHSQEALDWHQSIQAFQLALSLEENLPADFWSDFGHACLRFSCQLNDPKFLSKAIHCLKKATSLDPKEGNHHHLLATAMQRLYEHTHDEDHFIQANESFQRATECEPHLGTLWLDWAQFLCRSSQSVADAKRLRSCIEKCKRALTLDPEDSLILATWGEALALLGEYTERLDLIHEAQSKLDQASEGREDDPDLLYSKGVCLRALGHYFNDPDYYYQAIEQFQAGLSIDRTRHRLWHAIASAYALLGDQDENEEDLKLSLRFFQKALDISPSTYTLFGYAAALSCLGEITDDRASLEEALAQFEKLLQLQKNALYLHPQWLFRYGYTLDLLGGYHEEESYYHKAVEVFSHILMIDPEFPSAHHHLGLALSHLAEFLGEPAYFHRAMHHYRLSSKNQEDDDVLLIDWAVTLMNLACHSHDGTESEQLYRDAEHKIQTAMRLGNLHTYYHLACLYALTGENEKGLYCLHKAHQVHTLPPLSELLEDTWLDPLRSTKGFQDFLALLDQTQQFRDD